MERITGDLDISDIKRFQMTGTIIPIKCPKCKKTMVTELVDCIEYPSDGNISIGLECEKCQIEITREIDILSVIVTMDVHDPEITWNHSE